MALSLSQDEIYARREQTQVKHYILSHYLERFAHIVGSRWDSITYVDLLNTLRRQGQLPYDSVWTQELRQPLVWESDLKSWIKEWQAEGHLRLEGLQERERVPKRDHSHRLVWREKGV